MSSRGMMPMFGGLQAMPANAAAYRSLGVANPEIVEVVPEASAEAQAFQTERDAYLKVVEQGASAPPLGNARSLLVADATRLWSEFVDRCGAEGAAPWQMAGVSRGRREVSCECGAGFEGTHSGASKVGEQLMHKGGGGASATKAPPAVIMDMPQDAVSPHVAALDVRIESTLSTLRGTAWDAVHGEAREVWRLIRGAGAKAAVPRVISLRESLCAVLSSAEKAHPVREYVTDAEVAASMMEQLSVLRACAAGKADVKSVRTVRHSLLRRIRQVAEDLERLPQVRRDLMTLKGTIEKELAAKGRKEGYSRARPAMLARLRKGLRRIEALRSRPVDHDLHASLQSARHAIEENTRYLKAARAIRSPWATEASPKRVEVDGSVRDPLTDFDAVAEDVSSERAAKPPADEGAEVDTQQTVEPPDLDELDQLFGVDVRLREDGFPNPDED